MVSVGKPTRMAAKTTKATSAPNAMTATSTQPGDMPVHLDTRLVKLIVAIAYPRELIEAVMVAIRANQGHLRCSRD